MNYWNLFSLGDKLVPTFVSPLFFLISKQKKVPPISIERCLSHLVRRQIVDGLSPKSKACATLSQQYLDPPLGSRPRFPKIQHHHGDAGEPELPSLGLRRASQIQVGQRLANEHLLSERNETKWKIERTRLLAARLDQTSECTFAIPTSPTNSCSFVTYHANTRLTRWYGHCSAL